MFVATITKEITLPKEYALLANLVGLLLLVAGVAVYRFLLRRVRGTGGNVRSELLGAADVLVAVTLVVLLCLLLGMQWVSPVTPPANGTAAPPGQVVSGLQIIYGALQFALPVAGILALLIGRNISLFDLFGLKRVGIVRAVAMAGGLTLLLLPMFLLVTSITYQVLGDRADQQELVKIYQHAAKTGNDGLVWQVVIAAVCIAPFAEEILFRGYIYPVFKRTIGTVPAAVGSALLFGAIHNNALGFPGLTLLALALTLTYEFTGSLLVSVFMHAWFNGLSLFAMWWAVRNGLVT